MAGINNGSAGERASLPAVFHPLVFRSAAKDAHVFGFGKFSIASSFAGSRWAAKDAHVFDLGTFSIPPFFAGSRFVAKDAHVFGFGALSTASSLATFLACSHSAASLSSAVSRRSSFNTLTCCSTIASFNSSCCAYSSDPRQQ